VREVKAFTQTIILQTPNSNKQIGEKSNKVKMGKEVKWEIVREKLRVAIQ
jgi:hypothetical protein